MRTPSVLFVHNHTLLKSALKDVCLSWWRKPTSVNFTRVLWLRGTSSLTFLLPVRLRHADALPVCPNNLCKRSFIPRCLFCFLWSLNSVSYYCIRYCTTLTICVCHLLVLVKRSIKDLTLKNVADETVTAGITCSMAKAWGIHEFEVWA